MNFLTKVITLIELFLARTNFGERSIRNIFLILARTKDTTWGHSYSTQ